MATATKKRGTGLIGPALTGALAAAAGSDDPLALLNTMAGEAPAKKGSKERLAFKDAALDAHVAAFIEADQKADEWGSKRDTAAAQIRSAAAAARLEACRRAGRVEASIVVNGKVTFTQTSRFASIDPAQRPALLEAFGDDAARYFIDSMEISLAPGITGDPQALKGLVAALIAALGSERFRSSFVVKQKVTVSEAFHDEWTLREDVHDRAEPFVQAEVIKPYQPSLKVA